MATRFTNSDFTTAARKLGEKVFFKIKSELLRKKLENLPIS